MSEVTEEDKNMVVYFLREKGDITRWSSWEARRDIIYKEYPALQNALFGLAVAEDYLDLVLERDFCS